MEISLPGDAKRINFRYSIHKDAVLSKEAVYIAFPFAAEKPEFTYDTQNGFVNPGRDELAGGSREWYAVSPLGRDERSRAGKRCRAHSL
jgi:alpha-mannosidase